MNIGTGDAYEMIWFKQPLQVVLTMMMISYEGGARELMIMVNHLI